MHSCEKGEGGELEPALTRAPPGPIRSAHGTGGQPGIRVELLSAGGRALKSLFSVLWDSAAPASPESLCTTRGQRCSYGPRPITHPRDPSSDQRGCSSGCHC